ncbi:glycine/betaine ABC transporter substrate-binding protein [Allosaccharopolyspora coralli]|uniref:Glycine/betaine ABC transporter substrate-binding protein n=1 Tax=Allosaccharopolyspora coralli TaxID=2665642 RepID=A0A5Q3Q985_9PSEU|nr:ABC transporter substrate-binding protein [Allosaccharopolyspora coralli]QGK71251.1 glycine/betaine ABC transporter substrate-binding protein [Allosaccharopolyspora coralli]
MQRLVATGAAVALAVGLASCGSGDPLQSGDGGQGGPIVIGSADIAESELLMHIYGEALETTGAQVELKPRIGSREVYFNAARDGELSVVPDYTGNLLEFVNDSATSTEPGPVYEELQRSLPPELDVLDYSPAEDSDVLTVTAETAGTGIRSLEDLGPRCGEFVLGAPSEWKQRWETQIAETYGCTFREIRSVEAGTALVDELTSGNIQVANLFTTSSTIEANNLVPLEDPKSMFPAQNVVPLVGKDKLSPEQVEVLNTVSRTLTTQKLTDLNKRLEVDKANPADVAKTFVQEAGL